MKPDDASAILRAAKQLLIDPPREKVRRVHTGGGGSHTHKKMVSYSVIPQQADEFRTDLLKAGIDATVKQDGTLIAHSRRAQQEIAYFVNQHVNRDGGYHETIKEGRMRELDRMAAACGRR